MDIAVRTSDAGYLTRRLVEVVQHIIVRRTDCDTNWEISDWFVRICRNLSYYYSESSKKKSLYLIKYIFRLSCVKTLARKYKSNLCIFLKRLGLRE